MASNADEYYNRYKLIFAGDFSYSRKFAKCANAIIMRNIAEIHDHEKRMTEQDKEKDLYGADRTITVAPFTCGLRVRRLQYLKFAEFTMDTKEFAKKSQPDYYIWGYGNDHEDSLLFYMFWNHRQFMKLARENAIKHGIEQNSKHSAVQFLTFKATDIFDKCDILECGGKAETIRQVLNNRQVPINAKLGEFG